MVARTILDTLRQVSENSTDVGTVFNIVTRLAQDVEPSVRAELMEQVPHIAMYCQELPESLHDVVPLHLLPLVVKFLTDTNNQVRKTSQAALLVLLEQGLVDRGDVEEQVCPVILRLTESDSMDDYRTEAVALLSKMAPLIGKEMAERLFLQRFATLCVDPLFHVRKVCAANFGDFSGVVGSDSTEQTLLPKFFYLCEDGVWGVRKACADVFMPVSCVCSPTVRQAELSPLFINLLRDQSRWVRMAAFQALGPFISTFADPAITALLHNENGEIVITDPDQLAERLNSLGTEDESAGPCNQHKSSLSSTESSKTLPNCSSQNYQNNNRNTQEALDTNTVNNNTVHMETDDDNWAAELVTTATTSPEERRAARYLTTVESSKSNYVYSSFLYWRDPVPDLDLVDVDLGDHELDHQEHDETELNQVRADLCKLDVESSTDDGIPETTEKIETTTEEKTEEEPAEKKEEDVSKEVEKTEETQESSAVSESTHQTGPELCGEEDGSMPVNNDSSMWRSLPVITFQKFDDITGSQENSTMELFRPTDKETPANICTFDPQSRWETYSNSSIHSSRSSLDSTCVPSNTDTTDTTHPPDPALPKGPPETEQSIVPQLLIDHYVSMIDPSRAQTVDNDIARHCAFSLPAVALTLGRTNWPLLKETYEALANDMQWKVRRTLASSIHELGVILGEEVAASDLVPIFNGFIKDLDEVRIGILKHLADFLKLLNKNDRNEYLPRLEEFLKMDNERNWRFRLELTEQLGVLVPLFKPEDIRDHLAPIALTLVQDKVSSVRQAATGVICTLLANLNSTGDVNLSRAITADLAENLAHSSHWARRQTFAVLCGELLSTIPYQHFTQDLLPHLLDLTWDIVPNVRLKVAHVFGHILPDEHYNDTTSQNYEQIHQALNHLAGDKDHDVREAAAQADRVKPNPPPKPEVPVEPVLESKPPEEEAVPTWAKIAEVIQEIK